jgi:hypothetical protein
LRANTNAVSNANVLDVLTDTHSLSNDFVANHTSWTSLVTIRSHLPGYSR